jgi:hypothetical protein
MKFIKAFAVDNQAYYINIAHIVSVSKQRWVIYKPSLLLFRVKMTTME